MAGFRFSILLIAVFLITGTAESRSFCGKVVEVQGPTETSDDWISAIWVENRSGQKVKITDPTFFIKFQEKSKITDENLAEYTYGGKDFRHEKLSLCLDNFAKKRGPANTTIASHIKKFRLKKSKLMGPD